MLHLFDLDFIETVSPSSDIPATEEQSTLTTSPSIFEVSFLIYGFSKSGKPLAAINSCYQSVQIFSSFTSAYWISSPDLKVACNK